MARNTGRGTSSAVPGGWRDRHARGLEVWAEPEGVVMYDGERITAEHRHLMTPDEADALAALLTSAATEVRHREAPDA